MNSFFAYHDGYEAAAERETYRILDASGAAYTKRIEWWPEPSFRVEVKSWPCATREEADRRAWKQALDLNWTAPRWWQWWRWKEHNRRVPRFNEPESTPVDAA